MKRYCFILICALLASHVLYAQETVVPNNEDLDLSAWQIYVYAFLGCILQEFIYWFELKNDIAKGDIPVELNSKGYWIITVISIFLFSVASYFYFTSFQANSNFFTIAVFSAGFPRLFKGAVQQVQVSPTPGSTTTSSMLRKFGLSDYFMIR